MKTLSKILLVGLLLFSLPQTSKAQNYFKYGIGFSESYRNQKTELFTGIELAIGKEKDNGDLKETKYNFKIQCNKKIISHEISTSMGKKYPKNKISPYWLIGPKFKFQNQTSNELATKKYFGAGIQIKAPNNSIAYIKSSFSPTNLFGKTKCFWDINLTFSAGVEL